jgi:hypothetical protein
VLVDDSGFWLFTIVEGGINGLDTCRAYRKKMRNELDLRYIKTVHPEIACAGIKKLGYRFSFWFLTTESKESPYVTVSIVQSVRNSWLQCDQNEGGGPGTIARPKKYRVRD